ncbi:hypothetical protein TNCV_1548141 [Trichonephila clavipes]|nr:hypothetical protein TNCV_1548141 [Trichonephila clavipes]
MSYRKLSPQRARCMPVVRRRLEHYTVDSMMSLGSTPILRKNSLEVSVTFHFSSSSISLTRRFSAHRLCWRSRLHWAPVGEPVPLHPPFLIGVHLKNSAGKK